MGGIARSWDPATVSALAAIFGHGAWLWWYERRAAPRLERGRIALAAIGVNILVGYCGQISLGGGAFMTYYDARTHKTFAYNGRETAPAGARTIKRIYAAADNTDGYRVELRAQSAPRACQASLTAPELRRGAGAAIAPSAPDRGARRDASDRPKPGRLECSVSNRRRSA